MHAAIEVLEEAFKIDDDVAPPRERHATAVGDLLVMPAWDSGALGVKLVTVNRENPQRRLPLIHGIYILFDGHGVPVAQLDAEELTRIRTAAVSAVATRVLARSDARNLVVFGAGTQARGHIEAMMTIRQIENVTIVSRSHDRAEALADELKARYSIATEVGSSEVVAEADIVCTCTSSTRPVFRGELIRDGTHITAVGSYSPKARELDDNVMRRADVVVVERRPAALSEAGELVGALATGALSDDRIIDLRSLLSGPPEPGARAITIFKSVGLALEDLAVARLAVRRAS